MNTSNLKEMLPIVCNSIGEQEVNSVNARDLHKALNSRKDFSSWFKAKVKASKAIPEKDYTEFKLLLPQTGEWFDSELNPLEIIKFLESQTYVLESDFDLSFESKLIKFLNERGTHL